MIDTYLGALLSKGSYSSYNRGDTAEIAGWRPIALPVDAFDPSKADPYFAAQLYERNGEYVVAYRGTIPKRPDWVNNVYIGGVWQQEMTDSIAFAGAALAYIMERQGVSLDLARARLQTTGHSQGGFESELSSAFYGLSGTSLDGPGAYQFVRHPMFYDELRTRMRRELLPDLRDTYAIGDFETRIYTVFGVLMAHLPDVRLNGSLTGLTLLAASFSRNWLVSGLAAAATLPAHKIDAIVWNEAIRDRSPLYRLIGEASDPLNSPDAIANALAGRLSAYAWASTEGGGSGSAIEDSAFLRERAAEFMARHVGQEIGVREEGRHALLEAANGSRLLLSGDGSAIDIERDISAGSTSVRSYVERSLDFTTRMVDTPDPRLGSRIIDEQFVQFDRATGLAISSTSTRSVFTVDGILEQSNSDTTDAAGKTSVWRMVRNPDGTISTTAGDGTGLIAQLTTPLVSGGNKTQTIDPTGGWIEVVRDRMGAILQTKSHEPTAGGYTETLRDGKGDLLETREFTTRPDGGSQLNIFYADGAEKRISTDASGQVSEVNVPSHAQTLVSVVGDATALIEAIRAGRPLPQLSSGLRLLNDMSGGQLPGLPQSSAVAAGALSLHNFAQALENGDALDIVATGTSAAQAVSLALEKLSGGSNAVASFFAEGVGSKVLPGLGLLNAIRNDDPIGAATSLGTLIEGSAFLTSNPVGWVLLTLSLAQAMKGAPESWAIGQFEFADNGTLAFDVQGQGIGPQMVRRLMQGENAPIEYLKAAVASANAAHPEEPLGIIPQRLASVTWHERGHQQSGYTIDDLDPITGAPKLPGIRYDDAFLPINANTGVREDGRSLSERLVVSAIERGAIAPKWEVDTALAQVQAGDPDAGLSEVERAARNNLAAPRDAAGRPIGASFTPVALDLNLSLIHI